MNLFDPLRSRNPLGRPLLSPRQITPFFTVDPRQDGKFEVSCMLEGEGAYYRHAVMVDDLHLFFDAYIDDPAGTLELAFGWKAGGAPEKELTVEDFGV